MRKGFEKTLCRSPVLNFPLNWKLKISKKHTYKQQGLVQWQKALLLKCLRHITPHIVIARVKMMIKDVRANYFWASLLRTKFTYYAMHRAGELSSKVNNNRANDYCYRLLFRDNCNWKVVPDNFFNKHGGLNFLLRCNCDVKYLRHIPTFYRDILIAFDEIKTLYNHDQGTETILFNNKLRNFGWWETVIYKGMVHQGYPHDSTAF